jgi:hypothetical protein
MHSWEVVCIAVDGESDYNDCRAITKIGHNAPTLKKQDTNHVAAKIHQGHSDYHIKPNGTHVPLQAVRDDELHLYVRTLDEDTADDPLLDLPTCNDYELSSQLESI